MLQVSDMIGALEIGTQETGVHDGALEHAGASGPTPKTLFCGGLTSYCRIDSELEYASASVALGPTSSNAGCKNSVFYCIGSEDAESTR